MKHRKTIVSATVVAACAAGAGFTTLSAKTTPSAHQQSVSASGVRLSRIRLKTGVELQLAEVGPPNGDPVLFLHGFTDSWFSYSRVMEALPARVRTIVPSQRGHGDSERPACCYRVTDFVDDAVALLDALGLPRATVVGHSMGSFIAQRIAIDHPERVNRLVLVGSGATTRSKAVTEFNDVVQQLKDPVDSAFVRDFQVSTAFKPLPPAFLARAVGESMKVPARVWRDVLGGLIVGDAKSELGRIHAPTLVVWGERDALWVRSEQDELVRQIAGSRLVTYPEIGHAPHWEDPARFLADLETFLDEPTHSVTTNHAEGHEHHAPRSGAMPILAGLGSWTRPITTRSPEAQRYFDQGLALTYAFNHDEAARSFERAAAIDSSCALCYWGIAYAVGPNINLPMDPRVEPRALAAARKAVALASLTTPNERALIAAMSLRYGEPAGASRAARDSAYAKAMRDVAKQFPRDVDAQVMFADAMMNLRPWAYWTRDGRAQPGTDELVTSLETAMHLAPGHAGACHFYVHAVEASATPDRALPCAEKLPRLMPGAGHIVHMPAHVYLRVGRYADAARANIAAVESDRQYFAGRDVPPGMYPMFYAPHNLHFLWATYTLSGQRTKAQTTARALAERVSPSDARAIPSLQGFLTAPVLTLARFRDWNGVLAEPAPPADLQYLTGMWHYARGMAFAGRGDVRRGRLELDSVRAISGRLPNDLIILLNPASRLLELGAEVLAGEIAMAERQVDRAVEHFRVAARMEDALTYDEPPPWHHSTRNVLGEALLRAGRAPEAESAFRDDLRVLRETGWSLSGLERALRAQGKNREAEKLASRLEKAWAEADVPPHPERR
jgi:pimeloyl-ACP methyl ester carboxylesterase/tetratricopeptide (TPR) repeat protein